MAQETIVMEADSFDPVRKSVPPDTLIVWQNVGSASHVVDSVQFHDVATAWQFRTQVLKTGDSAVYEFSEEGIYEYYCGLQGKEMCGVVLVGDVSLPEPLPCE